MPPDTITDDDFSAAIAAIRANGSTADGLSAQGLAIQELTDAVRYQLAELFVRNGTDQQHLIDTALAVGALVGYRAGSRQSER